MELNERKYNLIQSLVNLNDVGLIALMESVLLSFQSKNEDWWDDLSEEEHRSIKVGLAQTKQGKTVSHAEVMAKINAKLEK